MPLRVCTVCACMCMPASMCMPVCVCECSMAHPDSLLMVKRSPLQPRLSLRTSARSGPQHHPIKINVIKSFVIFKSAGPVTNLLCMLWSNGVKPPAWLPKPGRVAPGIMLSKPVTLGGKVVGPGMGCASACTFRTLWTHTSPLSFPSLPLPPSQRGRPPSGHYSANLPHFPETLTDRT